MGGGGGVRPPRASESMEQKTGSKTNNLKEKKRVFAFDNFNLFRKMTKINNCVFYRVRNFY